MNMTSFKFDDNRDLMALMPASELRVLIEESGYKKEDVPRLLARAGVSPTFFSESEEYLDSEFVWRLLAIVGYDLNDECLGFFSQPVRSGSTELMIARAMQEPTLGRAMSAFVKAGKILWPDMGLQFKSLRGELHFSLTCRNLKALPDAAQIFLEIACIPFFCIFQWLTDEEIQATRVHIAHSRPENAVHLLAALNCPVLFEGEGVEIIFPDSIADYPTGKRSLRDWGQGILEVLIETQQKHNQSFASQELQSLVRNALHRGIRSQSAIASSVAMSVATLRRRLMMEKTSFREISDQVFSETVIKLIARGDSIETITAKAGYADARSFRRAFQRVFDVSPSDLRRSIKVDQAKLSPVD
tara:strand:+ start:7715 stop:8788 length:1074 start_codon:yes stop_codon:yes gene_type:complete